MWWGCVVFRLCALKVTSFARKIPNVCQRFSTSEKRFSDTQRHTEPCINCERKRWYAAFRSLPHLKPRGRLEVGDGIIFTTRRFDARIRRNFAPWNNPLCCSLLIVLLHRGIHMAVYQAWRDACSNRWVTAGVDALVHLYWWRFGIVASQCVCILPCSHLSLFHGLSSSMSIGGIPRDYSAQYWSLKCSSILLWFAHANICTTVSTTRLHLAHRYSSGRLYTSGYHACCRESVGRKPMSCLYPKAHMLASRLFVIFHWWSWLPTLSFSVI